MASRTTRASTRGSTPTLRAQVTRSRLVQLSEEPVPATAARGYISNQYGSDDAQPISTGAADVRKSMSFAAELREQLEDSSNSKQSQLRSSEQSNSKAPSTSPAQRAATVKAKAKSPSRKDSRVSNARHVQDDSIFEDELPSGIGIDRTFDDLHEAGLELPAEPIFLTYLKAVSLDDLGWAVVYSLPVWILLFFLSPLGTQIIITTSTFITTKIIAGTISSILSLESAIPRFTSNPITVSIPAGANVSTVVHTVTMTTPTVYVNSGRKDNVAKAMEEIRQELKGIKGNIISLSDRMTNLEEWESSSLRPNFLSPTLGAVIDPTFTSPTNPQGLSLFTRFYRTLYHRIIRDPTSLPPSEALRPWKENGDCWCAAGAPYGHLSLGAFLGREMHPMRLIIDHIPRLAALDPTTTPKRLDLWARVSPSPGRYSRDIIPDEWRHNGKKCESPQPATTGNEEWICLGKMRYDINSRTHTQSVSLAGYSGEVPPFKVDRIALRVVENYGQQFTCLYQVKLEGLISSNEE